MSSDMGVRQCQHPCCHSHQHQDKKGVCVSIWGCATNWNYMAPLKEYILSVETTFECNQDCEYLPYIFAYNAIARITRPPYFALKIVPQMHFPRITRPANFGQCPSAVQVKYPEI